VILTEGAAKVATTALEGVLEAGTLQAEKTIMPATSKLISFFFIKVTSVFFHCRQTPQLKQIAVQRSNSCLKRGRCEKRGILKRDLREVNFGKSRAED
jgi:hypothetical protein